MIQAVYAKSWSCHQHVAPKIEICWIVQCLSAIQSPSFGNHLPNCRFLVLFIANSKTTQYGLHYISPPTHKRKPRSYNFCSELLFAHLWSAWTIPSDLPHCQSVFTYLPATDYQFSVGPFSIISRHCMWAHIVPFWIYKLYIEKLQPHTLKVIHKLVSTLQCCQTNGEGVPVYGLWCCSFSQRENAVFFFILNCLFMFYFYVTWMFDEFCVGTTSVSGVWKDIILLSF